MNILCATDDKYVPYCGVMLTSLFESNRGAEFHIYILVEQLAEESRRQFDELAKKYGHEITVCQVDGSVFKDCPFNPVTDHVSLAAYFRLAVAEILPAEVDRILYLDCDIAVVDDISQVYNEALEGFACGVVMDEAAVFDFHYDRLGMPKTLVHPYLNSGVLLINMDYWRKHNVFHQCMAYIAENKSRLAFHDQDTLYGVLEGKVKYLPYRYNLQKGFLFQSYFDVFSIDSQKEILDAIDDPCIIHYTGNSKPWMKGCAHPLTQKWLDINEKSMWADSTIIAGKPSLRHRLLILRNELIWRLGLKPRPKTYII